MINWRQSSEAGVGIASDNAGSESKIDCEYHGAIDMGNEKNGVDINQDEGSACYSTVEHLITHTVDGPPDGDLRWATLENGTKGKRTMTEVIWTRSGYYRDAGECPAGVT